jgi:hypothetical protein
VVAKNFPQSAYSGLQKSLQQEWQFVQRVKEGVGEEFTDIERAISQTFLAALFGDEYDDDDPRRKVVCLPVKHAGLAIPDPTTSAKSNFESSILICSHLLATLRGVDEFRSSDHVATIQECKAELHIHKQEECDLALHSIASTLSCDNRRTILRGKETGQWLSILPSTVNGTMLLAQDYRHSLLRPPTSSHIVMVAGRSLVSCMPWVTRKVVL